MAIEIHASRAVYDAVTHLPVSSGTVLVNGVVKASFYNGQANWLTLPSTQELIVRADGYQEYLEAAFSPNDTSPVFLQPVPVSTPTGVVKVVVSPAEGAEGAFIELTGETDSTVGTVDSSGLFECTMFAGSYTCKVSKDGWVTQSLLVSAPGELAVQLEKEADEQGSQLPAAETTTTAPPVIVPADRLDDPEWIYPNSSDGTYFTTTQARMYIGGLFIDELNFVQFALQDNKIPVYGYRSRFMDAVAQGRSLVQGQLGINFISEGYLYAVLSDYEEKGSTKDSVTELLADLDTKYQYLQQQLASSLTEGTRAQTEKLLQDLSKYRATILTSLPPAAIDAIKQRRQLANTKSLVGYTNPVYKDVPFDIVLELAGGGRTVTRRLEKCVLISNEQILDQSGSPLIDSYGFIARRLR